MPRGQVLDPAGSSVVAMWTSPTSLLIRCVSCGNDARLLCAEQNDVHITFEAADGTKLPAQRRHCASFEHDYD
ncbi:MAG TPA: hypothetical protein VGC88_09375, partial [Terriglobales bacterium]